jgi:hypothetical protein
MVAVLSKIANAQTPVPSKKRILRVPRIPPMTKLPKPSNIQVRKRIGTPMEIGLSAAWFKGGGAGEAKGDIVTYARGQKRLVLGLAIGDVLE